MSIWDLQEAYEHAYMNSGPFTFVNAKENAKTRVKIELSDEEKAAKDIDTKWYWINIEFGIFCYDCGWSVYEVDLRDEPEYIEYTPSARQCLIKKVPVYTYSDGRKFVRFPGNRRHPESKTYVWLPPE